MSDSHNIEESADTPSLFGNNLAPKPLKGRIPSSTGRAAQRSHKKDYKQAAAFKTVTKAPKALKAAKQSAKHASRSKSDKSSSPKKGKVASRPGSGTSRAASSTRIDKRNLAAAYEKRQWGRIGNREIQCFG
jgi:hypothetical protein